MGDKISVRDAIRKGFHGATGRVLDTRSAVYRTQAGDFEQPGLSAQGLSVADAVSSGALVIRSQETEYDRLAAEFGKALRAVLRVKAGSEIYFKLRGFFDRACAAVIRAGYELPLDSAAANVGLTRERILHGLIVRGAISRSQVDRTGHYPRQFGTRLHALTSRPVPAMGNSPRDLVRRSLGLR